MANPIGRYRPPYPTREELLGLSARKTSDPPPAGQVNPVPKPAGQDPQQYPGDSPPIPPQKDDAPPLLRKDSLSPARWNENESSAKAHGAVDAHKDSTVASSKPLSLVEEIRQRRSEKRLKPVGPPDLSLREVNSTASVPGNTSPKATAERPLPSLPVQPTLQQLPPRNASLPGRQIKPPGEPRQTLQADTMGSSKSKPVRPEIPAPAPWRPLQNNTLPRASQPKSEETRPVPMVPDRESVPLKVEGVTVRVAELTQKRLDVPKPTGPPPPTKDTPPLTTKALPKPSAAAAEAQTAPPREVQRPQLVETRLLSSPVPPTKAVESYSTAISDLNPYAGRLPQNHLYENRGLSGVKDPEDYENDKLITIPSPSNYTDNSASISPLKDSNDSITPPSSYPDEDDRPLTPLNAPPANKAIVWNLNTVQYRCYAEHRNMKLSRNERHPMPCMLCNVADQETRRKCTWCCLRICKGCHWLLTEMCGRSVENLVDMLAKEGKTGAEVKGMMGKAPGAEVQPGG